MKIVKLSDAQIKHMQELCDIGIRQLGIAAIDNVRDLLVSLAAAEEVEMSDNVVQMNGDDDAA